MNDSRSANILSFASRATTAPMKSLREMHSYWDSLRADRSLPRRTDVDPREISHLLESGFLLERMAPGDVRFRLAGMGISDLMGMDVRSMPLRALIKPTQRPEFTESLDDVFTRPEVHTYHLVSEQMAQPALKSAMIILPMLDEDGEVTRALGALVVAGPVGFPPRRFVMAERLRTPIFTRISEEEITLFDVEEEKTPKPILALAEEQAEFTPAHPKAPFLRLVKS